MHRSLSGAWIARVVLLMTLLLGAYIPAAIAAITFYDFAFVEIAGRPGHQGYVPIQGSPVRGTRAVARVRLFGPVRDAQLHFIGSGGTELASFPLARPQASAEDSPELYGNVLVPSEPFTVAASGIDSSGNLFSASQPSATAITPATLRLQLVPTLSTFVLHVPGVLYARLTNYGAPDTFNITVSDNMGDRATSSTTQLQLATQQFGVIEISATLDLSPDPLSRYAVNVSAIGDATGSKASASVDLAIAPRAGQPLVIDVKPGSCANPIQTKSHGIVPVAILATADFDPRILDTGSIYIAGMVAPSRVTIADVGSTSGGACGTNEKDGRPDLMLYFDTQEVVSAIRTMTPVVDAKRQRVRVPLSAKTVASVDCGGYDFVRLQN